MGLEKLHPFDAGKWGKVINFLKEEKLIADDLIVQAREATEEDLLVVHTRRYLNKLKVPSRCPATGIMLLPSSWLVPVINKPANSSSSCPYISRVDKLSVILRLCWIQTRVAPIP
uniref:Histone deacetylase 11 n=1 Tax=Chelydra serpentina TaxID=8475 RepID=A0A8C3SKS2_CHESE